MHVASLDLCKELYDLRGWGGADDLKPRDRYRTNGTLQIGPYQGYVRGGSVPAYDLGYLLRKFAGKGGIEIRYGEKDCLAVSQGQITVADTPEDATCRLAIELFKQGLLKRGDPPFCASLHN